MIYKCPECGVYWYILSEYQNRIKWNWMDSLIVTDPKQTTLRKCPKHHRISAEVKA